MKEIAKLGAILLAITAICTGLLGQINSMTAPVIAENKEASKQAAMKTLLTEAEEFVAVEDIQSDAVMELYVAKAAGETVGFVAKVAPSGYGGPIETLVGMDTEGQVKGIQILTIAETPGLGANAKTPDFLAQFEQKLPPLNVVKSAPAENDICAITGATITTNAVTLGVNEAAAYINENMQQLMEVK